MKPRQLKNLGVPDHAMPAAIKACAAAARAGRVGSEIKERIERVLAEPAASVSDPVFAELASALVARGARAAVDVAREEPVPYRTWGAEEIDEGAHAQMAAACRLPVSVAGALMPDAHVGYGLPIGGVLATENCVIPYAVGVDIACRMMMTVFELPAEQLARDRERFETILERNTLFGTGARFQRPSEHAVIDEDWGITPVTAGLKDKARGQLGTSGSGNHFVEFGELEVLAAPVGATGVAPASGSKEANQAPAGGEGGRAFEAGGRALRPGTYLALLSHSGSRGPGAMVAQHYSNLARRLHPDLPKDLSYLAWLDLDREGAEYWAAMELMGRFASANHHIIHAKIARDLAQMDAPILFQVENHHNYAWRERHTITTTDTSGGVRTEERDLIVHRKGATPAGRGVLG